MATRQKSSWDYIDEALSELAKTNVAQESPSVSNGAITRRLAASNTGRSPENLTGVDDAISYLAKLGILDPNTDVGDTIREDRSGHSPTSYHYTRTRTGQPAAADVSPSQAVYDALVPYAKNGVLAELFFNGRGYKNGVEYGLDELGISPHTDHVHFAFG